MGRPKYAKYIELKPGESLPEGVRKLKNKDPEDRVQRYMYKGRLCKLIRDESGNIQIYQKNSIDPSLNTGKKIRFDLREKLLKRINERPRTWTTIIDGMIDDATSKTQTVRTASRKLLLEYLLGRPDAFVDVESKDKTVSPEKIMEEIRKRIDNNLGVAEPEVFGEDSDEEET